MALLAVLGNPVAHSRSPEIHQHFANQAGIELEYEKILVPQQGFSETAAAFLARGGVGFNITVPNKVDAFMFANEHTEEAQHARAVNTIARLGDGKTRGHNTDGPGLAKDLIGNLGWQLDGRRILILGAGGAVQGILASLLAQNPKQIVLLNRTFKKAEMLVAKFSDTRLSAIATLNGAMDFDIIVSASSAGLDPAAVFDLPVELLANEPRCYDMIYGRETPFLRWCQRLPESHKSDGLGMLVEQAARSFGIWFEIEVNTQPVIHHLRQTL